MFINQTKYETISFYSTGRSALVDTPPKYTSDHEYITLDAYFNMSFYARDLPPIPKNCPTPMGVVGK